MTGQQQALRWTDTHCHLADPRFDDDRAGVIARAKEAGVRRMVVVGDTIAASRVSLELAKTHDGLYAAAAIHPHHADAWNEESRDALRSLCREAGPKLVALGEIGLDFYYDTAPRDRQAEAFLAQAKVGREFGLPLVIHVRDAYDLFIQLAREHDLAATGGVVHCFSGTAAQAVEIAALGFHIGIGGVLTFKKNGDLPEVVREAPIDRLLIETDAPYLAPAPKRGKRNEPAYVAHTGLRLAEELALPSVELARILEANSDRLFFAR